jgi:ElaB/YqjD/DUF883 family membrane-anchored ribosome-binding protein
MSNPTFNPLSDLEADFSNGPDVEPGRVADRRTAVAGSLEKAAQKVAASGDKVGNLAHTTADKLDATAKYVRDHSSKDMMGDLEDFARKHPGKSLAAVAVLGFLAGRAFRSR